MEDHRKRARHQRDLGFYQALLTINEINTSFDSIAATLTKDRYGAQEIAKGSEFISQSLVNPHITS